MIGMNTSPRSPQHYNLRGMINVRPVMDVRAEPDQASFIGASSVVNGTGPTVLPIPAGSAAGDLCYVASMYNQTEVPAGFTALDNWAIVARGGQWVKQAYKLLTEEDIAAGSVSFMPGGSTTSFYSTIAVLRGATSVVSLGFTESAAGAAEASHLAAPTGLAKGHMSLATDYDLRAADWAVTLPWVRKSITGSTGSTRYDIGLAFFDSRKPYNGAAVRWSGFSNVEGTGVNVVGLLELR